MTQIDLRRCFPIRRPAMRGTRWLIGLALLAALLTFFLACGVFAESPSGSVGASWSAALFFSVIIAYVIPIFGYISERTRAALDAVRGDLAADPARIDGWCERIHRKPLRWLVITLTIGVVGGIIHNTMLYRSFVTLAREAFRTTTQAATAIGTELTWIVVTVVIAGLLDNAIVVARAGRHCTVDLLDTGRLRPFAYVAVISTLAIIGAQAAFPIMSLQEGLDAVAFIPGLVATGIPMLALAALPVWPVHRRIAAAKRDALARVRAEIAARGPPDPGDPASLAALQPLLNYRRELLSVSEWPMDFGVMTRLALYLVIPPVTWVGAALIEIAVDAML